MAVALYKFTVVSDAALQDFCIYRKEFNMEKQKSIAEIQNIFVIEVGADIAKKVSPDDRKKLADAYMTLFSGFTWVNWLNKYSLGRAWQTALMQCGAFVETKNKKNLAAKYLDGVFASHKKYWSRVIMMHKDSENKINPDIEMVKQLRSQAEMAIRNAMDVINMVLARYNEHTEELMVENVAGNAQANVAIQQAQANAAVQATVQSVPVEKESAEMVAQPQQLQQAQSQSLPQVNAAAAIQMPFAMPVNIAHPIQMKNVQLAQVAKPAQMVKPVRNQVAQSAQVIQPVRLPQMAKVAATQKKTMPKVMPVMDKKTVVQKPMAVKPVVRKPVAKKSVLKKPMVQKPRLKKHVAQKTDARMALIVARKRVEMKQAQMKMTQQQTLKLWMLGQQYQNAA